MLPAVSATTWSDARHSVEITGERFAELLLSVPSDTMATDDWTVAETAAHLVTISDAYRRMLGKSGSLSESPVIAEVIPRTTVDTVAQFNDVALAQFTERDLRTLAGRLREDIAAIQRACDDLNPDEPIDWLGGSRVPAAGVLAHLVNELQVHGRDIARATGAHWTILPADAALFFELFLLGVTRHGYGHLLDWNRPEHRGRVAVEFRSRYTRPAVMVLTDGRVTIGHPGRDIDVKVHFDPVYLNLMLFGRVSKARAALTGKVVVWGRRPWLLPVFMRKMRLPS
ncbi:maleylpyruvate isomerase family mycothiol-dependent enzyme [Actinomadura terrae]|uniref:maleylpyruvate isomerase family mycothiol-dependent enzyme n=1 Tax=Actinomadura terrae TaxID=604353 RepID=UPI001FA7A3E7|nr:maleylpyruvate isomerase family mycothiol-dependent enzyme [Actinomadura terrae]